MPPWLKAKTLDLPRWVWVTIAVGGVGIGLYLRSKNSSESEPEVTPETGPPNSGELVPPAAPIGSAGGGGGGLYGVGPQEKKPEVAPETAPHDEVELPESAPPPEAVVQEPHRTEPVNPAPVVGEPIVAPGTPGIGSGRPLPPPTPPVSENVPVAGPTNSQEKEKARNEVNRLQAEIDGLQNHISQLTQAIQSHPHAQQRGQWENERNADRANIDGKRNQVTWWNART